MNDDFDSLGSFFDGFSQVATTGVEALNEFYATRNKIEDAKTQRLLIEARREADILAADTRLASLRILSQSPLADSPADDLSSNTGLLGGGDNNTILIMVVLGALLMFSAG